MTEPEAPVPGTQNIYVQAPAAAPSNGMATASLVLGILGLVTAWIPIVGLVAWIFAPLGLIFGIIGLGKPTGKGLAIAGLICSVIALFICLFYVVALLGFLGIAASATAP